MKAGLLTELNPGKGYTFVYTEAYAASDMPPVSLTLQFFHQEVEGRPDGGVDDVVVGWMLVTEMMGWMCGVGCHPIHRAETLRYVMLPLQGIDNPEGVL